MNKTVKYIGFGLLIAYVGYGAFMAGVMANAMANMSWFGVAVFGVTAPLVSVVNLMGGDISGVMFVPSSLHSYLFEFGTDATKLTACKNI